MKVKANGIEIHYEVEGRGPWVTLSHSLATDLHMWDDQVPALRSRYKVLRYDIRGHGETDAPPGPYTLEQMAEDVRGLLAALGIDRTHFVGLSMGGMVVQTFAVRYPAMAQSLVLCGTASRIPPDAGPIWEERIRTVASGGMAPMVEPTLARWFTDGYRAQRKDVIERIGRMILATPPQGYIGCGHAIPKLNLTARLGELRCPALVIVGENDPGTPVAVAKEIQAAIPGAELTVLPSASHLSNIEQRDAFNAALLGFLDRIDTGTCA